MVIPGAKKIWSTIPRKVKEYELQYLDGLITQGEKYNKVSTPGPSAPTRSLTK
jgi:hypothetical protein